MKKFMENKKYKIIYGGWHQRTSIHMAEVYEFLKSGRSELDLDKKKLSQHWNALNIEKIEKKSEYLDYLKVKTTTGISINYFEDGLYTFKIESDNIRSAQKTLQDYYNDRFNPAISYIFSLGAPTAGKLTDARIHPTVAIAETNNIENFQFPTEELDEVEIQNDYPNIRVYKNLNKTLIVVTPELQKSAIKLAEMEIFLSEFYYHLRSFLNLHRKVWEDIASIKNRTTIKGVEAEKIRIQLDGRQKIINMVSNRLDQMGIFIGSRKMIIKEFNLNEKISSNLELGLNSLENTTEYLRRVWKMTDQYSDSAINSIVEIKNKGTAQGIKSLQLITSIGIIATIIGYLSEDAFPKITGIGIIFFLLIIILTFVINIIINKIYKAKKYKLNSD